MSGLATEAVISELADGSGLLEIAGSDWGQPLRETIHDHFSMSVSDFTGSRSQQITEWMSGLFLHNSDFVETEPANTFPTQIGRWLVRPAFTTAALTHLGTGDMANIDFRWEAGNHTIEDALDEFCARAGLAYRANTPLLVFDVADKPTTRQIWGSGQFASASLRSRRSRATGYKIAHNDGATATPIVEVIDNAEEVAKFGVIRRVLPSVAPNRPAPAEGETPEVTNAEIREILQTEAASEAVLDEATKDADSEFPWIPGTRIGIDWDLLDSVQINIAGILSPRLPIGSAALRMSQGNFSFRPGIGFTAGIVPQFRHDVTVKEPRR